MKKVNNLIKIISITIVILIMSIYPVLATINPNLYDPTNNKPTTSDISTVANKVNPIIGTIKVVGIVIAFIMIMVMGIKYMVCSVQEKAEYKKVMGPYFVGAIMIVAITQLVGLIASIVTSIK